MFSQWRPRRQSGRRVMEQGTVNSDDMEYNILNINIRDTDVYNISDPDFLNVSPSELSGWVEYPAERQAEREIFLK